MPSVLVIGIDPKVVPDMDADAFRICLDEIMARFADHGIDALMTLITLGDSDKPAITTALSGRKWDVVVVGGGIRAPESLVPVFEQIVNLIRQYAPQAAIAFNTSGADTVEAARHWLTAGTASRAEKGQAA